MNQEELEQKVREIFEQQGFEIEEDKNGFRARKDGQELPLKVFSSEEYSRDEVERLVDEDDRLFVDDELSDLKDEELENQVSVIREEEKEKFDLPSFEMIGDIAVINELPEEMSREEAVEGIRHHQNVKTILLKEEPLQGEFRVGEYEKLYGEETETVHKEFGCRFRVDPTKVYFSERFGTERKRVVDQIKEGEKVLVIGAGVGPFPVLAGKHSDPDEILAVEKNPDGTEYLKENVEMNKLGDKVEVYEGDVREVVPDLGSFDRIVMPLPRSADEFLDLSFDHIEYNGVIHYYRFLENDNWKQIESEIVSAAESLGKKFEITDRVECGDRGPNVKRVCVDIKFLGS